MQLEQHRVSLAKKTITEGQMSPNVLSVMLDSSLLEPVILTAALVQVVNGHSLVKVALVVQQVKK